MTDTNQENKPLSRRDFLKVGGATLIDAGATLLGLTIAGCERKITPQELVEKYIPQFKELPNYRTTEIHTPKECPFPKITVINFSEELAVSSDALIASLNYLVNLTKSGRTYLATYPDHSTEPISLPPLNNDQPELYIIIAPPTKTVDNSWTEGNVLIAEWGHPEMSFFGKKPTGPLHQRVCRLLVEVCLPTLNPSKRKGIASSFAIAMAGKQAFHLPLEKIEEFITHSIISSPNGQPIINPSPEDYANIPPNPVIIQRIKDEG